MTSELVEVATTVRDLCARFDAEFVSLNLRGNGRDYSVAAWQSGVVSAVDMEGGERLRIESDGEIHPDA